MNVFGVGLFLVTSVGAWDLVLKMGESRAKIVTQGGKREFAGDSDRRRGASRGYEASRCAGLRESATLIHSTVNPYRGSGVKDLQSTRVEYTRNPNESCPCLWCGL